MQVDRKESLYGGHQSRDGQSREGEDLVIVEEAADEEEHS